MNRRAQLLVIALIGSSLAGCSSKNNLVVDESVGVAAVRGACPASGIPDYTGDVTLLRPGGGTTAQDIDVVATMTNLRTQCDDGLRNGSGKVTATSTFDVLARRSDTRGARVVSLPYYVTVLRGGTAVVSKRIAQVTLNFADGQERAQGRGQGMAVIDRSEATLSEEVRNRITRKRKAGSDDAAIDPLTEPDVKAAVDRATFELLVGFQLTNDQLAFNVRR